MSVGGGGADQWPFTHSSSPGATQSAPPIRRAKPELTWYEVGMGLTHRRLPEQRVVSGRKGSGCNLSIHFSSPHSGLLQMDSGLSLLLLGPMAKELGPG